MWLHTHRHRKRKRYSKGRKKRGDDGPAHAAAYVASLLNKKKTPHLFIDRGQVEEKKTVKGRRKERTKGCVQSGRRGC